MATALIASALLNVWFGLSSDADGFGHHLDAERLVSRHGLPALRAVDGQLVSAKTTRHQILHLEFVAQHRQHCHHPALRISRRRNAFRAELAALFFCPGGNRHRRRDFASGSCCPIRRLRSACRNLKARTSTAGKRIARRLQGFCVPAGVLQQIYLDSFGGEFFCLHHPLRGVRLGNDHHAGSQTHADRRFQMDARGI